MKNMLKKSRERGQAMAEYQVLFPAGILLAGFMLPLIAFAGKQMYCEVVSAFDPNICIVEDEIIDEVEEDSCTVYLNEAGSQCDQDEDCILIDVSINDATWFNHVASDPLQSFLIKAGQDYFVFESGLTNDGCYMVDFAADGYSVSWEKVGDGPDCQDVSHVEMWYKRICVPD